MATLSMSRSRSSSGSSFGSSSSNKSSADLSVMHAFIAESSAGLSMVSVMHAIIAKSSYFFKEAFKQQMKKDLFKMGDIDRAGLKRTFILESDLTKLRPWYNEYPDMKDPLFQKPLCQSEEARRPGEKRRRVYLTIEEWEGLRLKLQDRDAPGWNNLHPWLGGNGKGGEFSPVSDERKIAANKALKELLVKHAEKSMLRCSDDIPKGGLDYDVEFAALEDKDPERKFVSHDS